MLMPVFLESGISVPHSQSSRLPGSSVSRPSLLPFGQLPALDTAQVDLLRSRPT
jgi:hypothetical protein